MQQQIVIERTSNITAQMATVATKPSRYIPTESVNTTKSRCISTNTFNEAKPPRFINTAKSSKTETMSITSTSKITIPANANVTISETIKPNETSFTVSISPKVTISDNKIKGAGIIPILSYKGEKYIMLIREAERIPLASWEQSLSKLTKYALHESGSGTNEKMEEDINMGYFSTIGGGKNEDNDETVQQCAIRETKEEIYSQEDIHINEDTESVLFYGGEKKLYHKSFIINIDENPDIYIAEYNKRMLAHWEAKNWAMSTSIGNKDFTFGICAFSIKDIKKRNERNETNIMKQIKVDDRIYKDHKGKKHKISQRAKGLITKIL